VAPTFTLTGTTGNDLLNAPGSVDTLVQGLAGNDTIKLTRAGDAADAGAGNDTISLSLAGTVVSTISGGLGNDTISLSGFTQFSGSIGGASGADVINLDGLILRDAFIGGGAGSDTINILATEVINSTIQGGDNGDKITFGSQTFTTSLISGAKGADTIVVAPGSTSTVTGGDGQDDITILGPAPYVAAGAGSDTITTTADVKTVIGGGLNDVINLGGANGLVYADASGVTTSSTATGGQADGNDQILATGVTELTIYGAGGNDTISTLSIADVSLFDGGDGADSITVDGTVASNVSLIGGLGGDIISVSGAISSDVLIDVGAGSDAITVSDITLSTISAGAGLDTITINGLAKAIKLDAGSEADLITFTAGSLSGGTIAGGDGADTIKLDTNNKAKILGGAGNDFIRLLNPAAAATVDLSTIDGGDGVDTISVVGFAGAVATAAANASLNAIYGSGDVIYFGGTGSSGFTAANFATGAPSVFVLTAAQTTFTNCLSANKGDVSVFADANQTIFYVVTSANKFAEFRVQGKDLVLNTTGGGAKALNAANFGFTLSTSSTSGLKITLA
jgi:hypothetical protein